MGKTQKRIVASAKHQVLWGRTQEIWNWREYWTLWRTFKQIGSVWKTSGFVKTQKIQKSWIFNIIVVESEANWERLTNIGSYDPKFNHVV